MDLLNETDLLKVKSTLFNLFIRETSRFLCYEWLLNMTYVAYKNAFFREMQFWSHCYTVVSYQALFRLSVYKIPAVYLSGAKIVCFLVPRLHTFACREELEWPQKLFHDQSPRKYGTRPGLNLGPLDLQVRHVTDCAMWPGPGYKTI